MAEDRSEQYLKAVKDDQVVNVGAKGTKSVDITGEPANTKVPTGKYKTAYDNTADKSLSAIASELKDVGEFTTLPIKVTGVNLDKTTAEGEVGSTIQLKATVQPSNATNKAVVWSSDNEKLATVDQNGKATLVAEGKANIKVATKDGNKVAQCALTIKPKAEEPPAEGK